MKRILIFLIKAYQHTLSPDHGIFKHMFPYGVCKFEPTCSQYAIEAIQTYGMFGIWYALRRIVRCHPFAIGGYDPLIPIQK